MSLLVGLVWAALVLGVVGLIRAVAEFGMPGLLGFAKLTLAPAAIILLFVFWGAGGYRGGAGPFFPSKSAWRKLLVATAILTGIAFALSGALGVGWLVKQ
jgi:hypothetical protein